jgi:hypothetical protein
VHGDFSTCSETVKPSGLDKILAAMTAATKKDVPVTTPEQLLTRLRSEAAAEVRTHLTPTTKKIKVTFKDNARDLAKADQEAFRSAAASPAPIGSTARAASSRPSRRLTRRTMSRYSIISASVRRRSSPTGRPMRSLITTRRTSGRRPLTGWCRRRCCGCGRSSTRRNRLATRP